MKKKLLLDAVLKLKSSLEKSMASTFEDIIKYNITEMKVDLLWAKLEKMEVQLIHFKEVIQEANKSKFEGKTNNYHIYFLSNLRNRSMFYENLLRALKRTTKDKAKLAQISREEIQSRHKATEEEITKFQNKLSAFNSKKKVVVILDESLNLL